MRRAIGLVIALVCLCTGMAQAEFLGIKKSSERVTFRLKEPVDSAYGIERKPDSCHILIRCDTGTVSSATPLDYKARSTTYPFVDITNTPIDTTKDYGDTVYWFTGVLSNFGATTNSQVTITVDLYTGKYATTTAATYQVIADSLNYDLKQARDSAGVAARLAKQALDSIQLYDNWLKDSIHNQSVAILAVWTSTVRDSILANFADANAKMKVKIGAMLDSIQLYDNWLKDSVHNQSVAMLAVWTQTARDSILANLADANAKLKVKIAAMLDSIQLYDNPGHLLVDVRNIRNMLVRGSVVSAGRADSTVTIAEITDSKGVWKWGVITFLNGADSGQTVVAKAVTKIGGGDSVNFVPKLTAVPAAGDSLIIALPQLFFAGARLLTDSTATVNTMAKANRDTLLQTKLDTYTDGVLGSFFDSCLLWARTSTDSAAYSRWFKRLAFAIGPGSDSVPLAQRLVSAAASVDSALMYRQVGRAIHDSTATKGQLAQASRDSLLNAATSGYQTAGSVGKAIIEASTASGAPTALQIVQTLMAYRIDTCTGNFNLFGNRARAGLDTTKYVTVNQAVNSFWSHNIFANTYTDSTAGKLVRKMGMAMTAIAKNMQVLANNYVTDPAFAWYDTSTSFSFPAQEGGACWTYYSNANVTSKLTSDLLYSRTGRYWRTEWTNSSRVDSVRLHNAYQRIPQGVYEFGLCTRKNTTTPGALPDTVIVFLMDSVSGSVIDSFRYGGNVTSPYNQAVQDSAWREISKLVTLSADKTAKIQFRASSADQVGVQVSLDVCYFFIRPLGGGSPSIMANAFWNLPFNTAFTPGSMGDSANNASYMQGSAGTVTDSSIVASIRNDLAMGHMIALRSDSGNNATAATVWAYGSRSLTDKAGFGLAQNERGAIGDTVWRKAFSELRDAVKYSGKIGFMLSDSIWLNNIQKVFGSSPAAQYLKQMFTGERAPMYLSLFDITGAGGSQGVMIVRNTSDGPGMAVTGGDSTSVWAPAVLLTGNGAAGAEELFGGKSGPVVNLTSRDQGNNYAAYNVLNPYGVATRWKGAISSTGYGFISEGGRGVRFYGYFDNGVEMASAQNNGLYLQGGVRNGASGLRAEHQNGNGGYPMWLESLRGDHIAIHGEIDTVNYARNGGGGGGGGGLWADTNAYLAYHLAHAEAFYGPFNTGNGIRSVRIFVLDTMQVPDRAVQAVYLTIANQAGVDIASAKTGSSGSQTFNLDDGTYLIKAFMPGWYLAQKTVVIAGNADSVAVVGYNVTGSSRICNVWGTVIDDGGNPMQYATVSIAVPDAVVATDSSGVMQKLNREVQADAQGRFAFTVLRSSAIGGAKYTLTATKQGYASRKVSFAAPDAANYRVYFR